MRQVFKTRPVAIAFQRLSLPKSQEDYNKFVLLSGHESGREMAASTNTSPCPGRGTRNMMQAQQSVDLGMLDRVPPEAAPVDITVTPAISLPGSLTYSQGQNSVSMQRSKSESNLLRGREG